MSNSTAAMFTPTLNSSTESDAVPENIDLYYGVTMFSIVFLFVVMIPTVIINGMTLFAIYKDPLKCFRNPLMVFATGVIVADFISGLIVFPFFGAVYAHDLHIGENDATGEVYHIAIEVLTATITISFLTLSGLAVSQLIAIKSPMRFDRCVTTRSVKIGLVVIWVYATLFTAIPYFFDYTTLHYFYFGYLIFHVTIITVSLVILYIVTYLFFAVRAARHLDEEENKQVTREFFKGSCILSLLQILLVWPATIALYAEEFLEPDDMETAVRIEAARLICDDLLFIKFLLDPIILVWRVPKYRLAMKKVYSRLCGFGQEVENKSRASYNRANISKKEDDESIEDVDVEVI